MPSRKRRPMEIEDFSNPVEPHAHDVLCGRGNNVNQHPGNHYFRSLVSTYKVNYVAAPKAEKGKFSQLVLDSIKARNPPGRFLKQHPNLNLWYDIGPKKAMDKTRQALREGAPDIAARLLSPHSNVVTPTNVPKKARLTQPPKPSMAHLQPPLVATIATRCVGYPMANPLAVRQQQSAAAPPPKNWSTQPPDNQEWKTLSELPPEEAAISGTVSDDDVTTPDDESTEEAPADQGYTEASPGIAQLNDNDVVCWDVGHVGYDIIYAFLPGNVQFRRFIDQELRRNAKHQATPLMEELAGHIVNKVQSCFPPGRFLKKGDDMLWHQVGNVDAIERTVKGIEEAQQGGSATLPEVKNDDSPPHKGQGGQDPSPDLEETSSSDTSQTDLEASNSGSMGKSSVEEKTLNEVPLMPPPPAVTGLCTFRVSKPSCSAAQVQAQTANSIGSENGVMCVPMGRPLE